MPYGISRRTLLGSVGLASARNCAAGRLGAVTVHAESKEPAHVLVSLFLRGGADGLSLVPPYGDDAYYRARPTIALAPPGPAASACRNLDGYFGLHPALAPLLPLFQNGEMAIVHAAGSADTTHSHFAAMSTMERGEADGSGANGGWLARYLAASATSEQGALRAAALGDFLPKSLQGSSQATAIATLSDFDVRPPKGVPHDTWLRALEHAYNRPATGPCRQAEQAGHKTLAAVAALRTVAQTIRRPALAYPDDALGRAFHDCARLIQAPVGAEVLCVDCGGFDTHVAQGGAAGQLASRLTSVAGSLAAFAQDLGPHWQRVTVLVQSEFGRRIDENGGAGTDHGHGGVMFVLGGRGLQGGRVHGRWPGLGRDQRTGPGDLAATTDYRDVLTDILTRRMQHSNASSLFPGLQHQPTGIAQ